MSREKFQLHGYAANAKTPLSQAIQALRPRITGNFGLDFDDKRGHFLQCLYHGGENYLAATQEWLMLFVDLGTRRVAAMPDWLQQRLAAVQAAHAALPVPPVVGRSIRLGNRRTAPG